MVTHTFLVFHFHDKSTSSSISVYESLILASFVNHAVKFITIMLESIRDAQIRALDNTPENLQYSDKYEAGEIAVEAIEDAIYRLADAF